MTPRPIVQCREKDPLVQVKGRSRDRQRSEEPQDAGAASDLRGAGRAALDMGGQACGVGRTELIEQECIDERAGSCAVQGLASVRCRHITYMTRQGRKVAVAYRENA